MQSEQKYCDIVMAGGITSGVVFPDALHSLSQEYRFKSIGGSSAGAIAAAAAAAAELGRTGGGSQTGKDFDVIKTMFEALHGNVSQLFHPVKELDRLFRFAKDFINGGIGSRGTLGVLAGLYMLGVAHFAREAAICIFAYLVLGLPFFVAAYNAGTFSQAHWLGGLWLFVSAIVTLLVFLAAGIAWALKSEIGKLSAHGYGMCPGPAQPGLKSPGLMDWVGLMIERASGRCGGEGTVPQTHIPLSFGDLNSAEIELRMMTTNLSLGIGYALPSLGSDPYYFKRSEMLDLLPGWVVADLMRKAGDRSDFTDGGEPLHRLPTGLDMPVLLGVRMSLSFPVLLSAVPLYKLDRRSRRKADGSAVEEISIVRRVLFSDGGITSNFPTRFFDSLVPSKPTFGISLEDREEESPDSSGMQSLEVFLPFNANSGRRYEIKQISSLSGFLFSIVNTAREWQDRKQSRLTGWRERIARVYLGKGEGGLNLDMGPEVVGNLARRGKRVAALFRGVRLDHPEDRDEFDFSDHQWRRFLVAYAQMEQMLVKFSEKWNGGVRAQVEKTSEAPKSYKEIPKGDVALMMQRFGELAKIGKTYSEKKLADNEAMPEANAKLQIIPHD